MVKQPVEDENVAGDEDLSGLAQVFEVADSSKEEQPGEDQREEGEDDVPSPRTFRLHRNIQKARNLLSSLWG